MRVHGHHAACTCVTARRFCSVEIAGTVCETPTALVQPDGTAEWGGYRMAFPIKASKARKQDIFFVCASKRIHGSR